MELLRKNHEPETGFVTLTFNLSFHPTIGDIRETIVLTVTSATGATWRFPIKLEVAEPPPDDIIKISGPEIGSASILSFDIFSDSGEISFTAGFLQGSGAEFSVEPSQGTIKGAEGQRFTITYRPKTYGTTPKGRLVISSSDKTVNQCFCSF